jgi:hypothetical protein
LWGSLVCSFPRVERACRSTSDHKTTGLQTAPSSRVTRVSHPCRWLQLHFACLVRQGLIGMLRLTRVSSLSVCRLSIRPRLSPRPPALMAGHTDAVPIHHQMHSSVRCSSAPNEDLSLHQNPTPSQTTPMHTVPSIRPSLRQCRPIRQSSTVLYLSFIQLRRSPGTRDGSRPGRCCTGARRPC